MSMHSRGRGMVPPLEGKPPSRFLALPPLEEYFFGDSSTKNNSNDKFMPPTDRYDVEASNAVNSVDETYSLDGRRKVVLGRGTYVPPENKIVETRELPDLPELPDEEIDHFPTLNISQRYKQLSKEPVVVISPQDEHLNMVFKLGQCVNCYRPSLYVCATCKAWYCSESCRCLDSKEHRKTCTSKSMFGFNPDDTLKVVDKGQFSDAKEKMKNLSLCESGSQEDYNGNAANRSGGRAPQGSLRDNKDNNRGGDRNSDSHGGSGNLNNGNKNMYRGEPFEDKGQISCKSNIQTEHGPESATTTHQSYRGANDQRPQPQPPIPYNQFTEVTVTALANEKYKFWAYSNSVLGEQAEIMQELNNYSKSAKPFNSKLIPGLKVCAPFCGEWYRAEVKHINGDEVTILFIDFGNEASVNTKDILPLPLRITNEPVLAHQYFLAASSDNPLIADDVILKLKPIRLVGDAWLAHVEGVKYEERTEDL